MNEPRRTIPVESSIEHHSSIEFFLNASNNEDLRKHEMIDNEDLYSVRNRHIYGFEWNPDTISRAVRVCVTRYFPNFLFPLESEIFEKLSDEFFKRNNSLEISRKFWFHTEPKKRGFNWTLFNFSQTFYKPWVWCSMFYILSSLSGIFSKS